MTHVLRIRAKAATGFRRCGTRFTAEGAEYATDAFAAKDVAVLSADPNLIVRAVEIESPEAPSGSGEPSDEAPPAGGDGLIPSVFAGPRPEDVEAVVAEITAIIRKLGEADFTRAGPPKVASVERLLGRDVTAEQVAAAWEAFRVGGAG